MQKTIEETNKIKTLTAEEQKGMEAQEINQIMEQLYINYATQKYLDSVKKKRNEDILVRTALHNVELDPMISKGIDKEDRL